MAGEHILDSRATDLNGTVQPVAADLKRKKTFLEDNRSFRCSVRGVRTFVPYQLWREKTPIRLRSKVWAGYLTRASLLDHISVLLRTSTVSCVSTGPCAKPPNSWGQPRTCTAPSASR